MGSVLQAALSIFGIVGGPLLGIFSLGFFFPFTNSIGAVTGLLAGLVMAFWIGIGSFVDRMAVTSSPVLNITSAPDVGNVTTTVVTTLLTSATAAKSLTGLKKFHALSYMWYSAHNSTTVVIVGIIVSLLTGPMKGSDVDPRTVYLVLPRLLFFLPDRYKERLRFGVPHIAEVGERHSTKLLKDSLNPIAEEKPCNGFLNGKSNGVDKEDTAESLSGFSRLDGGHSYVVQETSL
ncbi:unnamed protein product [Ranitomeya imitator]|uniref:Sodium-dependent multivitamin transporter n=2 Tax=Ranitomeya imitator TaxID=111125 RepID=A0ABN9KV80_9NEOB|nr:unnamed protein product [Ranitomeya imitator]